jgi:hypothetical protein
MATGVYVWPELPGGVEKMAIWTRQRLCPMSNVIKPLRFREGTMETVHDGPVKVEGLGCQE